MMKTRIQWIIDGRSLWDYPSDENRSCADNISNFILDAQPTALVERLKSKQGENWPYECLESTVPTYQATASFHHVITFIKCLTEKYTHRRDGLQAPLHD